MFTHGPIEFIPFATDRESRNFRRTKFPMSYTLTNSTRLSSGILEMTIRFHSGAQTWQVFEIQKKPIVAQKKR